MPRKVDPAKIAHGAELYRSGKTFKEAAAIVGMDPESLRLALRRRGVEARPRSERPGNTRLALPVESIVADYMDGMSEKAVAEKYGVSRNVITRRLREQGIERRGPQLASALHAATLTPAQHRAKTRSAHDAIRGMERSEEWQCNIARGRERVGYGGRTSPGTDLLCTALDTRGLEYIREKAIGRYNVDIALSAYPVAVEVLGGNWHGAKTIHAQRTPYILNRGWHLVFIWNTSRTIIKPEAVDHIVAWAEELRVNPPSIGQYRVLRGNGELITAGQADDDDFPLVPPTIRDLDLRP